MSKTVTMRVPDSVYEIMRTMAERENRPLSNFIETATLRYIEEQQTVDEFEMRELAADAALNANLERGQADAQARRGRFV